MCILDIIISLNDNCCGDYCWFYTHTFFSLVFSCHNKISLRAFEEGKKRAINVCLGFTTGFYDDS